MGKWSRQKQIKEEINRLLPKISGDKHRMAQGIQYNLIRSRVSSEEEALAEMKKQGFYP